jgi:hypothetical protein
MNNLTLPSKTIYKIEDAAAALIADGNPNPTNEQVRAKLGGGSLSHISPVMRNFRARQRAINSEKVPVMSAELHHSLSSQLELLWRQSFQMAEISCHVNLEQAFENIAKVEQERDTALNQLASAINEVALTKPVVEERDRLLNEVIEWRTQAFKLQEQATRLNVINEQITDEIIEVKSALKEAKGLNESLQYEILNLTKSQDS